MRRVVVGMALLVGLVATNARAQGWSAMSGQTLGSGVGMVWGQFGWPGISADLAYGVSPTVDPCFEGPLPGCDLARAASRQRCSNVP